MLKHLKSVGMLLFLSTISGGAVYASSGERVTGIDAVQQNGTCTGVVKDGTGETVIGASVVVKGSTNGTITGIDGDFTLNNVPKGSTLVISFVGYETVYQLSDYHFSKRDSVYFNLFASLCVY